jgi:histidine kinase/DNA gyrase B/HSP90-like ATPase
VGDALTSPAKQPKTTSEEASMTIWWKGIAVMSALVVAIVASVAMGANGEDRQSGSRGFRVHVAGPGPHLTALASKLGVSNQKLRDALEFARGSTTRAPGFGLGLVLVAQQAALHGGSVTVGESSFGGARFTARLPLNGRP